MYLTISAASSSITNLVISFGCFLYPYGANAPINSPFSAFVLFTVLTFLEISFAYISFTTDIKGPISLLLFFENVSIPSFTAIYLTFLAGKYFSK